MTWILSICSTVIAIGAIATWWVARGETWRWGSVRARGPELGDGPFRSAAIMVDRPRGLPAVPASASAIGIAWGMLTLCFFAPMGILLSAITVPAARLGLLAALGGVGSLASTLSGFAIGTRMLAVSKSLVVRTPRSAEHIGSVAMHAALHHVLVFATVAAVEGASGMGRGLLAFTAVPCAIGLGVAALLAVACSTLRRLDRADATAAIRRV